MEKFLKPKEGLIVRDPVTMTPLSKDGEWKPWIGPQGRYWRRRINCGDCFDSTPQNQRKRKE
ncbi:hypothetical protein A2619_05825 [candidate division WWE3 bacterium RIFOXYD1_FULL_39_9]|uniref:Uncharacterized protein n=1 Tax=candidate division WWE3 bacterium RIFOXYD1_FULL_39_9 TaxID=1802649 RepID=A0A1F4X3X5_UNCKA|nr:MAG: hypothetical protein A2619_05825 [candidate division WWE3 bacterium RIFOXYD1_FULL_39_9]